MMKFLSFLERKKNEDKNEREREIKEKQNFL